MSVDFWSYTSQYHMWFGHCTFNNNLYTEEESRYIYIWMGREESPCPLHNFGNLGWINKIFFFLMDKIKIKVVHQID